MIYILILCESIIIIVFIIIFNNININTKTEVLTLRKQSKDYYNNLNKLDSLQQELIKYQQWLEVSTDECNRLRKSNISFRLERKKLNK